MYLAIGKFSPRHGIPLSKVLPPSRCPVRGSARARGGENEMSPVAARDVEACN